METAKGGKGLRVIDFWLFRGKCLSGNVRKVLSELTESGVREGISNRITKLCFSESESHILSKPPTAGPVEATRARSANVNQTWLFPKLQAPPPGELCRPHTGSRQSLRPESELERPTSCLRLVTAALKSRSP